MLEPVYVFGNLGFVLIGFLVKYQVVSSKIYSSRDFTQSTKVLNGSPHGLVHTVMWYRRTVTDYVTSLVGRLRINFEFHTMFNNNK